MNRLLQFFQEDSGNLSGQRLCFVLWNLAVCVVWTYCSFVEGKPVSLEIESIMGLAIAQAGKVSQKMIEKS